MAGNYNYAVYFECPDLLPSHEKKVEIYFRNHRKSGGGDCGPLQRVCQGLFSISFTNQKDQREVLQRANHVVVVGDVSLKFKVQDVQVSPQTNLSPGQVDGPKRDTAASPKSLSGSSLPPSGEEYELQLNQHCFLKDCPEAGNLLDKQLATLSCTAPLYPEEEKVLVRRINQPGASDQSNTDNCKIEVDKRNRADAIAATVEEAEVKAKYSHSKLQVLVCLGDITKQKVDALVNSANEDLKHSGGVAQALSNAGGPEVQEESTALVKNIGKVSTGDVVVTTGGKLQCKKLLHAVGPVIGKAGGREKTLIQKAINSALNLCEIMEFKSIALPCIGSGVFGVPVPVCTEAIVSAVRAFGNVGGRSLNKITLIDNRREVVNSLKDACDRLLEYAGAAAAGGSGVSVRVETIQGTIETQQVDAVVSPMVGDDPCSTRVGTSLFETAGPQLRDAFRKEAGGEMPGDSVLVDGLTGLPFNAVFFVRLVPWDHNPNGAAEAVLRLAVSNVLTSCENQGFTSVALPVLGAGILLGFPDDVVLGVVLEEVHNFEQRQTCRTPFLVHIVRHPNDKTFEETLISIQESLHYPVSKESYTKRIVLLGKTGSGKSSLGNTIFGETVFVTDDTPNSGTNKCRAETRTVNGRSIALIDTPGFFDSGRPEEELMPEILSCITECAPGPHAFLVVLKVETFSEQEQAIIRKICQYFSEEALQYATVVFTYGDQLPPGETIEQFISKSRPLSELLKKCGNRCHVVDNKYWDNNQQDQYRNNNFKVEELLKTIDIMVMENNMGFYTNKALKAVEKEIENEEQIIKESAKDMTPKEIRTEAKSRVSNRFLIIFTGIATGIVLGAIFGVEALVRVFIIHITDRKNSTELKINVNKVGALGFAATVVASVVRGGIAGGAIGAAAADEADSVQDAFEKTKKGVMKTRENWF